MDTVIATVIVRRIDMTLKILQTVAVLLMIILNCYIIKQNLYVVERLEQPNVVVSKCDLINIYDDGMLEETIID